MKNFNKNVSGRKKSKTKIWQRSKPYENYQASDNPLDSQPKTTQSSPDKEIPVINNPADVTDSVVDNKKICSSTSQDKLINNFERI